jgi:hypothetical protein
VHRTSFARYAAITLYLRSVAVAACRPSTTVAGGDGAYQSGSTLTKDKAMDNDTDFTRLGDPEFLAERRRVREELEHRPTAELTAEYERLSEEFLRRARLAWGGQQ